MKEDTPPIITQGALSKTELGDDLCNFCPLEKKGVYSVDGGYVAGCEGSKCHDAYDNFLSTIGDMNEFETQIILKLRELRILDEVQLIVGEYERACTKHPTWPDDIIHGAAIVAEEAGETIRAAINAAYEGGDIREVSHEATQTAATCIRLIKHVDAPFKPSTINSLKEWMA